MSKNINRVIAAALSSVFVGQALVFGDGRSIGPLHPDSVAYAADAVKAWKNEKELADEFEQMASELGGVDYFETAGPKNSVKSARKAQAKSASADPYDDIAHALTIRGSVALGEVAGAGRADDPPIFIRIFNGSWEELKHKTVHNGDSYEITIEEGYSDVYHVKFECDGYLPFYLKDFGLGTFTLGSGGSHDTLTLVPGDTTNNPDCGNQWSDDWLNEYDAEYVESCLGAIKGATDSNPFLDSDGDGDVSQEELDYWQSYYIELGDESIEVPANAASYDLNCDGMINTNDAADFDKYVDNVITSLPNARDFNGDGDVNYDDCVAYWNFIFGESGAELLQWYDLDLNHDGTVDSDDQNSLEYYANLPKRSDNYFEYMDKNADGVIGTDDLAWFEAAYTGDTGCDGAFRKYLRVDAGAYFPYSFNLHDTDLDMNGHTLCVNEHMSFNTDMPQFWTGGVGARLDVNGGALMIGRNLVFRTASPDGWDTKPGQTLDINGGTVFVGENFDFGQANCCDTILMTNAADDLTICGNWTYITDTDMEGKWTAGKIHFYGENWNVNEASGDKSIYSSGTHSIEFFNPNGHQTVLWANTETYIDDAGNTSTGRRFNFDYVDENGNGLGVIFPYGYSPDLYWFRPWFRTSEDELTAYRKAWEGPDGVNAATGNFKKSFEDYSITAPGVGADFIRSYNSTNPEEGSFGTGWEFNIDVSRIETTPYSSYIQVVLPDGSNTTFEKLGANSFRCINAHSTLEEVQVGTKYEYTLTNPAQCRYHFNTDGRLDGIFDPNGNKMTISDIENNKRTVTDSIGREYYIWYNGSSDHRRITKLEDPSAHKEVVYEYNDKNQLKSASNVKGARESYYYDENGKLNRIVNCFNEVILTVAYVDNGRVDNTVNEQGLKQVFVYDRENCQTGMEEYDGSRLLKKVTYDYDEDYAIVGNHTVVDGVEYVDRSEYYKNAEGKNKYDEIKKATDVSGNVTEYEYDSNGNITKTINPDGTYTLTRYNDKNMPVLEIDEAKDITIYEYDAKGVNVIKESRSITPVANAYDMAADSFDLSTFDLSGYAVTTYDYYEHSEDQGAAVAGLIRAVTDPEGNVTEYTYNSLGLAETTVTKDSSGNILGKLSYTYNDALQPSEIKEYVDIANDVYTRTEYEYDQLNNVTGILSYGTGTEPVIAAYEYDALGRKTAEFTPNYAADRSAGSTYTYNRGNLPTMIKDAAGNVSYFEYDVYGNLIQTVNPDGTISITEYDALQRETATYFKDGASSPRQIITKNEYEYTDADYHIYTSLDESYTRRLHGLRERSYAYITAEKQVISETLQDFRGNTVSESVNGKVKKTSSYYADGSLARETDALGNTVKYEYGFLGGLTKTYTPFTTDEDGNIRYAVSEVQYDKNGNVTKTIDPAGEQDSDTEKFLITENKYDGAGKLIEVKLVDPQSNSENITRYTYDNAGNVKKRYTGLSSENDTDYLLTEYEYDEYLRAVRTTDSTGYNSGTTEYDLNGNVIRSTDPNGNITVNTYDALDRLVRSETTNGSDPDDSVVTQYRFDKLGRNILSQVGDAVTVYEYDKMGRVVSETDGNGNFKGYFYTGISDYVARAVTGQRHLLIYSDAEYTYDDEMRVSSVSESGSEIVSFEYDANGNRSKESLANGITTEYAYNCINAVVDIRSFNGENEIASSTYKYYLDGSDSCKTVSENGIIEKTSYVYNGFGQLTEEKVENGALVDKYDYTYDDFGNRVRMAATGTVNSDTVYNYNDAAGNYTALLQSEKKTGVNEETDEEVTDITAYTYDNNGNQLSKISNEKTENFTYDVLDQLTGYTDGENTASYTYNADGLRSTKTVNGQTIAHVWDGNQQIIADVSEDGPYFADCYFFGAGITAKYSFGSGTKTDYSYYRRNAHGDVVSITDSSANNIRTYRYDAFGVEKNLDESDTNVFRYCGEYYDAESDTVYLRARYYSPDNGRFLTRDSYSGSAGDPLSLNLYTYCHNNPVLNFDPSGHFSIKGALKSAGKKICKTASKAGKAIKQWGKDRVDDWKTGMGVLKDSGPAGQVFASYCQGVVDTLGSQISAIRHPVQTAKSIIGGVKSFVNDPVGSVKSMVKEKINSAISLAKDIHNGDWQSIANKTAYALGGASVGIAEGAIGKVAMAKAPAALGKVKCAITGGCFVAGTTVATIFGGKAIETIRPGDMVLASDPETGETAYKEVLDTYTYVKDTLVYVDVNGETIETTKEHPFWVEGQGWTKAEFLEAGDMLRDSCGNAKAIHSVEIVPLPVDQYTIVYNLKVADFHTYYVSDSYILVHNTCPVDKLPRVAKPEKLKNALSNYKTKKWNIGGNAYTMNKKSMKHILERHHPKFWNGSVKSSQSFFSKKLKISDIDDIANRLMLSNADEVSRIGLKMGRIKGNVNGVNYVLGLKKGRVGQLYPE
ncbi:polymorphic toxin-type HINT domain-containing protein [uncultured Ruminococcus sp.]|uniref:polymorphic toxin-type HINT domain-containing protein n=1 Tax=uncultured Ruminococcus sp. TaxID=165186 RepID=UPI00261F2F9D|nr:polymorphic toxin-type HINT domain-containing protein [uncultured Ruminococcus sp.]